MYLSREILCLIHLTEMFYLRTELNIFLGGELPWVNWEAEHFQLLLCCLAPQRNLPTSKPLRNVNTHCSPYPSFARREIEVEAAQTSPQWNQHPASLQDMAALSRRCSLPLMLSHPTGPPTLPEQPFPSSKTSQNLSRYPEACFFSPPLPWNWKNRPSFIHSNCSWWRQEGPALRFPLTPLGRK